MAVPGYVLKNQRTTLERAEKFISSKYFTDCNLFNRLYKKKAELKSIKHYAAPDRITYKQAVQGEYKDTKVGESFGPAWATHWFQLEIEIPDAWEGDEVRLIWDSDSEAMVWRDGVPVQGLNSEHKRTDFVLTKKHAKENKSVRVMVEMACNGLFGVGAGDQINPPEARMFRLVRADLSVLDHQVWQLYLDIQVLVDLVRYLPKDSNRSNQALFTVNEIVNMCQSHEAHQYVRAHELAQKFFAQKNGATQHTLCAIGNCHIDTAWLWPYAETIRKCARSFSATIRLLEDYPNFTFACSQAQQFEWMKEHYPSLYTEIKKYVAEGRFIPVGGAWVEMDGNIPSGESFIRQFLYGQRYFEKELGSRCREFWLPDTFGYTAQLPQIMNQVGIHRFVTQKISWNLVNQFPHHTFWWSGIDGSRVLTHFPPGDSYGMQGNVEEVTKSLNQFKDKGRSNHSMYLYGFGDGGQGPTADMIEKLQRMKDLDGLPKVEMSSPEEYFRHVETYDGDNLCSWKGELYLELHNGTYTTQAKTKQKNRECEYLLRQTEAACSLAVVLNRGHCSYPRSQLDHNWKLLLLNQFHDVLPGSSISMVYKDALKHYKEITTTSNELLSHAIRGLFPAEKDDDKEESAVIFNALSWPRTEVLELPSAQPPTSPALKKKRTEPIIQTSMDGLPLVLVHTPSVGYSVLAALGELECPVKAEKGTDDMIFIENDLVQAVIDPIGRLVGLFKPGNMKDGVATGQLANQFVIFDDVPLYWDAWDVMDYHLETRKPVEDVIQHAMIMESGPLRATVKVCLKISDLSYITQYITLDAGSPYLSFRTEVTWHESHKFLKVEFPINVLSPQATYEIPFGHLQRPTHFNTSWDWAKFEVCGHKWADLSEYDWGVSVLNDSKYGWSCIDNVLRLSLLRSPKAPDEKADMGPQSFTYAVMPHTGTFQSAGVIQAAYGLNNALHLNTVEVPRSAADEQSWISIDTPAVVLDTIKIAEDRNDAMVLRLYEAFGGSCTANIKLNFPVARADRCNGLEDIQEESDIEFQDGVLTLNFKPFEIVSVLLAL